MILDTLVLCIAMVVYYEAKDAPLIAQEAVAQAVLNRVRLSYGKSNACDVVFAPLAFPWAAKLGKEPAPGLLDPALDVAWLSFTRRDFIDRATHFHPASKCPAWVMEMRYVGSHGGYAFYSAFASGQTNKPLPVPCTPQAGKRQLK